MKTLLKLLMVNIVCLVGFQQSIYANNNGENNVNILALDLDNVTKHTTKQKKVEKKIEKKEQVKSEEDFDKKIIEAIEEFEDRNGVSTKELKAQKFEILKEITIMTYAINAEMLPKENMDIIKSFVTYVEPIVHETLKAKEQVLFDIFVLEYFYIRMQFLPLLQYPLPKMV